MNPPTTSIDDLPPEMISELFGHLHPKDLAACSLVNRRWHSIYAAFKMHRLIAIDYDVDFRHKFSIWCDSNPTIPQEQRCSAGLFRRLVEKPLVSNLKHLVLAGFQFEFDFNQLNRFSQLLRLEINVPISKAVHLNLPKLRVLWFCHIDEHLSIDCPMLSELVNPRGIDFQVKQPETIRKLNTNLFGSKLTPFNGVECLVTTEFKAISKATLLLLPRLKDLHYSEDIKLLFSDFRPMTFDRMKRTLHEFLEDAKQLKGRDFQFTFAGFQLTKTMLNQIDFGVHVDARTGAEKVCNEYVYMKNYHLIAPGARLEFVSFVDYNRLLSNLPNGKFPSCFFQKFNRIVFAVVHGVIENPDHLLWFLSSLRSLRRLNLLHEGLSQAFYDQLPASAPSLSVFIITAFNELQLNFEFIGKLSRLSSFYVWSANLSLQSLSSLIGYLGKSLWATFSIQMNGNDRRIRRSRDFKKWQVCSSSDDETLFETENAVEILNFVQQGSSRTES